MRVTLIKEVEPRETMPIAEFTVDKDNFNYLVNELIEINTKRSVHECKPPKYFLKF